MGTSMTASSTLSDGLREFYIDQSARIQQEFESTGDGRTALAARTRLVEEICQRLWQDLIAPELQQPNGFALIALGQLNLEKLALAHAVHAGKTERA